MSVYSGFSTRQQEVTYNRYTETMLLLLQDRLLNLQRHGEVQHDKYWLEQFLGVYSQMRKMEGKKYFPPKLTRCVRDLATSYGLPDWDEPFFFSERKPKHPSPPLKPFASPQRDFTLLHVPFTQDLDPSPHRRHGRKPRRQKESPGKYIIEWADLKPKSRKYYNNLLLRKLQRPKERRMESGGVVWRDW